MPAGLLEALAVIGILVVLEGILAADNALIMAVLVRRLPERQRKKALYYGILGAFVLRFIALLLAQTVIRFWFVTALGAVYLLAIALAHFLRRDPLHVGAPAAPSTSFWGTVALVEFTDAAFAVDAVLIAVALSQKLWLVYTGAALGIILMRVAAGVFLSLLDRRPQMTHVAYAMVMWIALELGLDAYEKFSAVVLQRPFATHLLTPPLFWGILGVIGVGGTVIAWRRAPPDRAEPLVTLEELQSLAGLARVAQLIGPSQERIIRGASRLSLRKARDIMIPVDQVSFLSTTMNLADAVVAVHLDAHTRYPVCEGDDRNRVVGYMNVKEILCLARVPGDPQWHALIRPVRFVAPGAPLPAVLKMFVEEHVHLAVVRGVDGETVGLIALEDIIEELVGELEDEFDHLPHGRQQLPTGAWMLGGGMPVREVAALVGAPLGGNGRTISAWLIERLGRAPSPNASCRDGGVEFIIRRTRRGKVLEVAAVPAGASRPPQVPAEGSERS